MTRRAATAVALALAAVLALLAPGAARAAEPAPWRDADAVRTALNEAQSELIVGTPADARAAVRRASAAYARLRGPLVAADSAADRGVRTALRAAAAAAGAGARTRLAAARGSARAALLRGSFAVTVGAAARGDAATARRWLLVREFRTATRFTRPGADATLAAARLERGRLAPAAARQAAAKDLLDAYQARLRELLGDAARGNERGLPERRAEAAAQAAGYFDILAARYAEDRGEPAADRARAAFERVRATSLRSDEAAFTSALAAASATLRGFTAAPLTAEEAARRAQQLLQFLKLVPVEYGRGVAGTKVTKDFEIQEAVAFQGGAAAALADLADQLAKRDPRRTASAQQGLDRLGTLLEGAQRTPGRVATHDTVTALTERTTGTLEAAMPPAWKKSTDESDYDLIALTLDRMEAAAGAGQYRQAEQARLEAYAFFEFGPERRLKAFDPGLALEIEGLVWFGAPGTPGLATLISKRAPRRELRQTRRVLDERLADAAATLGDSANRTTVVTNSAIIVFREGLEAVLILAAITASFVGAKRRLRRPVLVGAGLGLLASVVTWVLAQTILSSLEQYGEKLEAVVGLIAIAVLLLITNWFFHRVYWSEWIAKFHRQRKRLEKVDRVGFISAQVLGLAILGLTSVYREGFETVLFLQSLELSAGTATVLEGAGLGLALTLSVAVVTFALQRKLPYKRMLVITGVMIGFVLVVMVGQTARTMQGTGWLPITPVGGEFPYWWGLWFGVYPTWETLGAQLLAAAFVIGSYFVAQEVRVKRPQRRARTAPAGPKGARPQPVAGRNGAAPQSEDPSAPRGGRTPMRLTPFVLQAAAPDPDPAEVALSLAAELHQLDLAPVERALDALAAGLSQDTRPAAERLRALGEVMAEFASVAPPASIDGLLLDRVLECRAGDPLLLAVVAAEVGRRAGLELTLLSCHGRPLVAYVEDGHAVALDVIGDCPRLREDEQPHCHCAHQVAFAILGAVIERATRAGDLVTAIKAAELRLALPLERSALAALGSELLALRVRLN